MINVNSIWGEVKFKEYPTLNKDVNCEVLVIGGGLSGLLIAYYLQKNHHDVILVEQNKIASNISKNTTASISIIQDKLYKDRIKDSGFKTAKYYLDANLKAIEEYDKLSQELDFDYKKQNVFCYTNKDANMLQVEYNALHTLGLDVEVIDRCEELPIRSMAIKVKNQATCNPLKLMSQLANNLTIYENTKIVSLNSKKASTDNKYTINFSKAIVATHYPCFDKLGFYFLKMYQNRSNVLVLKQQELNNFYISIHRGGLYFRSYKDYLLIGGYDYRVGECRHVLEDFKEIIEFYYNKKAVFEFANQDLITLDEMPYVGRISHFYKNIYVATGFNGYGFTGAMISSMVLKDIIEKNNSDYIQLFSPQRKYLLKPFFKQLKIAIKNMFIFKKKKCTHMGCKLNYNVLEKTYECMCHGSRFDQNGKLKNEPAKKDLKD